MTGTTTTLCVRRATYWDEEMGKEDPAKKGVCSNYLCDANPGMKLKLTGPSGKVRPQQPTTLSTPALSECVCVVSLSPSTSRVYL